MLIKKSMGDRIADIAIAIIMILVGFATLYPFWYLLSLSMTSSSVPNTEIYLIPPKFDFTAYWRVLTNPDIGIGFYNTIYRTVFGTAMTVAATVLLAYPLSKKDMPFKTLITGLIVFTMYFSGGLIPTYLLVRDLGLMENRLALMLPGLISAFHLIIVRNFFAGLPDALEESAKLDGANDFVILFRIIMPLSMAIIATLTLWTAVGHWNAWFDALVYVQNSQKQVLQNVMRRIVLEGIGNDIAGIDETTVYINPENLKAATIMVTTIPIIMVYPFLQKYFVKGVLVGSLKG